jgi:hypothetical protein
MQRLLQFRLRTLFLLIAVVACFLAWRLHDPERRAVEAIERAGGRVHFHFHEPSPEWSFSSIGMLPGNIYLSQVRVTRHGPTKPPPRSAIGFLLGNDTDHCVAIVELKLEQLSPAMIEHLKSLRHVRFIVVDMPQLVLSKDSVEAQRLAELKQEFGSKLCSAYNRGAFAADGP